MTRAARPRATHCHDCRTPLGAGMGFMVFTADGHGGVQTVADRDNPAADALRCKTCEGRRQHGPTIDLGRTFGLGEGHLPDPPEAEPLTITATFTTTTEHVTLAAQVVQWVQRACEQGGIDAGPDGTCYDLEVTVTRSDGQLPIWASTYDGAANNPDPDDTTSQAAP